MNSVKFTSRRVFVNGRFLTQQISGVQAFARSMCKELINEIPDLVILVPENSAKVNDEFADHVQFSGKLKGHFWEQLYLPKFMKQYPDAILINLCNSGPIRIKNQVATIHDLAFIKNPGWFHLAFSTWYNFMVPKLLKNSKITITVSETIKKEIAAAKLTAANKIIVVGNKVADELLNAQAIAPSNKSIAEKGFFLMVGSTDPRKNFKFIERFFATQTTAHKLVIVGGANKNFSKENQLQSENIIRNGYTSPGELKWLYQHAIAFINPSLYEGFGIPNLEAMAFECHVICSDIPVFREICKNAVFYFDLGNKEALKKCIEQVLENKILTETKTLEGKGIFTEIQNQNRTSKILKALFE
jgi:glycosyltransferase involved in cell wall biosynthesis